MMEDDFKARYITGSEPSLVDNENKNKCKAYEKWTSDFFKANYSDVEIELSDDPVKRGIVTRKLTISEYLNLVDAGAEGCPYHVGWPYEKNASELNEDIALPTFHPADFIDLLPKRMQFRRRWIFFGKKDLLSDLHVDCFSCNGWILMIQGEKTIRCVSPMYEAVLSGEDSLFDDSVVKRLEDAGGEVFEYKLFPGNILYIPSGWSHHVRNDTNTIMITQNFAVGYDVVRFYRNYRKLISRDLDQCDSVYNEYILSLSGNLKAGCEKSLLIDREIEQLKNEIDDRRKLISNLRSLCE